MENNYCGFVSIIGRPNVGKSTLMNHLIGQKISITSRKPQTTQRRIIGVLTKDNAQCIFVDTPGFQKRHINKFNTVLNQSVVKSLGEVDAVLFVVEAGLFNAGDEEVIKLLPKEAKVILVVNKKDKIKNPLELNKYVAEIKTKFTFQRVVAVSAKHHNGLDEIVNALRPNLPLSEFLYPVEQLTSQSSEFLVSEIIREKLFRHLGEELPYSVAVEVSKYDVTPTLLSVAATILVDKYNQKGIVIGKGGEKLKSISTEARIDMENLVGTKVFLQLWVKVKQGFADEAKFLQQFE